MDHNVDGSCSSGICVVLFLQFRRIEKFPSDRLRILEVHVFPLNAKHTRTHHQMSILTVPSSRDIFHFLSFFPSSIAATRNIFTLGLLFHSLPMKRNVCVRAPVQSSLHNTCIHGIAPSALKEQLVPRYVWLRLFLSFSLSLFLEGRKNKRRT